MKMLPPLGHGCFESVNKEKELTSQTVFFSDICARGLETLKIHLGKGST